MRTKYVDDTTTLEIIPRNSFSMLDVVVREIHDYCIEHKMKVNPKKCKFHEEFDYCNATYKCWKSRSRACRVV